MHNNFYFLRQLTHSLSSEIIGAVLSECYSQSKNELVLRFELQGGSFYIKASLLPEFSCLSFPETFNRARKNSVDLFELLPGHRVVSITQYQNERSFAIGFTDGLSLLFKMHGNKSNVILFENNSVISLFRKKLVGDKTIDPSLLDRHIDWSFENFKNNLENLSKSYFTFGKVSWKYLDEKGFEQRTVDEKWKMIQDLLSKLNEGKFYVTILEEKPTLSLVEIGNIHKMFTEPIQAINHFFGFYNTNVAFAKEKKKALSLLASNLKNAEGYITKAETKLNQIRQDDHYKVWADIIMANLHVIQSGQSSVKLPDLYSSQLIEVKLRKDLSPQKNAELYYKKARNHNIEIEHLSEVLKQKEKEVAELKRSLAIVDSAHDIKALRSQIKSTAHLERSTSHAASQPYHEFVHHGFRIWVGKNASANDELTQKYAYKEDLWLHAKDVAGSHVVVKFQAGKKFPKDVIERAAQLAAFNSKRKNESLCPVIVTPKKYVRKRKGDPPGVVVVEREKIIMVEPVGKS